MKWFRTVVGIAEATTDWKNANLSTGVDEEVETGNCVTDVEEVVLRFVADRCGHQWRSADSFFDGLKLQGAWHLVARLPNFW